MLIKRCCLGLLIAFCFVLSGCFSASGNLTIHEDGTVRYEATMATIDMLKSAIDEQREAIVSQNKSAKVEPYSDGNMSGYKITADYPSVREYAKGLSGEKDKTTGLSVNGIREVRGWFYDAYSFDFNMKGNDTSNEDPEAAAMAQAMLSKMKFDFTINLPYAADFNNADKVSNENKTLYWNLAETFTSGKDKSIQTQFKIWHKSHIIITFVAIGILVILAIILGVLASNSHTPGDGRTKGILAGVVFFVALLMGVMSLYMLFSAPKFTDNTVISQTTSKETANQPPTTSPGNNATVTTKPQESAHNSGVITGTEVRMRANPNKNANILGYFEKGETVDIIEVRPEWVKVRRTNGAVGWVSDQFCKY